MIRSYQQVSVTKRNVILIVMGLLFLIVIFRFIDLQITQYNKYYAKARGNSIRKIPLAAPRGIIYDRNHIPLVDNRPIYELKIIPADIPDNFDYELLSHYISIDIDILKQKVKNWKKSRTKRFRPQLIKRHVDFNKMSLIEENKLKLSGVIFSELPARIYPSGARLTHGLGYLRTVTESVIKKSLDNKYRLDDVYGFSGLEKTYESLLRGKDGVELHSVDIYGRDHGLIDKDRTYPAQSGQEITLTIDSNLQIMSELLLEGKKGAVVCMEPHSGEILAFTSAPDYDLNSFVGPIPRKLWDGWNQDEQKPLMNRCINGAYPPGSTFKMLAIAKALELGNVSKQWKINCTGEYFYGNRVYKCWNPSGHGEMNMKSAIANSCNIYFYQLIQKISFKDWNDIVFRFGFGQRTGVDLPYESRGLVPTKKYMDKTYTSRGWARGNLLSFVIGQGDVLATPIQVAQMVNLIATNGKSHSPHFNIKNTGKPISVKLDNSIWRFIQSTMWEVVNGKRGTGKNARVQDGIVRGKTGTSENPHGEDHAWFAGYVTAPNGKMLSVAVIVEHGGHGSESAAPVAKELFAKFVEGNK
jgi:penicillin-binding protein 2